MGHHTFKSSNVWWNLMASNKMVHVNEPSFVFFANICLCSEVFSVVIAHMQQVCIPVGCVPPASWLYRAEGGMFGWALPSEEGLPSEALWEGRPLVYRQTRVKTLPCPILRMRAVKNDTDLVWAGGCLHGGWCASWLHGVSLRGWGLLHRGGATHGLLYHRHDDSCFIC